MIRGGAIGDFILTLPAIKALRDAHPAAHLEILGYKHIAAIAEQRFYAQTVRSIEYGPLASFFSKNADLPAELRNYFASFDLIVSYLFDPDAVFESNLRRCGVKRFVTGPAKIVAGPHATRQLATPIEQLDLRIRDFVPKLYPSDEDRNCAREFLAHLDSPIIAFHPGSGSAAKNWPVENWGRLGRELLDREDFRGSFLVVSGEADRLQTDYLESMWKTDRVRFAENRSLPELAAILQKTLFLGHDSGVSHLAAAAGASCILLFGPTDAAVWAPLNQNARVLQAKDLSRLDIDLVRAAIDQELMRIGIST